MQTFFFYTFLPNFVIGLSETGTNAYGRTLRNTYARVRIPVYYGYMCRDGRDKMRRMVRHTALLLLLLLGAVGGAYAQPVMHGPNKSLMGIEVHFRFDKHNLDLNYMGNAEALERFAAVIDSIGHYRVDSVVIVSQSSPEGAYEHNRKLSINRARTMRRTIEQRHPELADRLHVHPDGESWAQLRELVKNDTLMRQSTIDQVLAVIDADVNIHTKKWRMEQLPIYRYLYRTYYPRIRNSVFCVIYYDILVGPAELPAPAEPSEYPDELTPHDIYLEVQCDPVLNVRTNLLYDMATVLNVGVEYYPTNSHWTFLADWTFPWWSHDKSHLYLQMLNGQLEARRYFRKDIYHTGYYLSAYGHANLYDFSFNAEDAWQGEGWGAGIGLGYVWRLDNSHRWKMEAFVKLGYYQTLYDPYHASDPYNGKYYHDWEGMPEDFIPRNHRLRWFGPTGAGITISYDLIYKRVKRKNRK